MKLAVILLILAVNGFAACGKSSKTNGKDFVGNADKSYKKQKKKSKTEASSAKITKDSFFTVDLIVDLAFRHQRDGWHLLTNHAQVNVNKLRKGGVDLFLSAIGNTSEPKLSIDAEIEMTHKLIRDAGSSVVLVRNWSEVSNNKKDGIISAMLLLEGADDLLGYDEARLQELKSKGVAVVGLVGGKNNVFADAAVSALGEKGGLTSRGAQLVRDLADSGIGVDLTHASKKTFYDVIVNEGIMAAVTHGAANALREHPRNLDDLQILTLLRYGGVVGLIFNRDFLHNVPEEASIDDVVAHLSHIRKIGAQKALSLGTDYNGILPIKGLEDISALPQLASRLSQEGFSDEEIRGVMGENVMRYLKDVNSQMGSAEFSKDDLLRPLDIDCDTVVGEYKGIASKSCDGLILEEALHMGSSGNLRLRIRDVRRYPVRLELFGIPNTPWQVEAQNLEGKVLVRRGLLLDDQGRGVLPLPKNQRLTRVFLSPTRTSSLREVVIWGN